MANNETLFSINAGQILATLHLAGVTQAPDFKPICNTGVINCSDSDSPEKPGKAEFDFSNKSLYEIGFFVENEYTELFNLENNTHLAPLQKAVEDAQKKLDAAKKKSGETVSDEQKTLDEAKKALIIKKAELCGLKEYSDPSKINVAEAFVKIDEEITKLNETTQKDIKEKRLAELKKKAFINIKQYIATFSGKENANKVKEEHIVVTMLPKFPKSINDVQIKAFKILDSGTDSKLQKEVTKVISDQIVKIDKVDGFSKIKMPFCYKIGYSLENVTN